MGEKSNSRKTNLMMATAPALRARSWGSRRRADEAVATEEEQNSFKFVEADATADASQTGPRSPRKTVGEI